MKKQIEPRQNKIFEMREKVKTSDIELENFHTINGEKKSIISEMNENIAQLKRKIKMKKERGKKLQSITERFGYNLSNTVQLIQEPNALSSAFQELYEQRNKLFTVDSCVISNEVLDEYERQRTHLSICVSKLKKQLSKQSMVNSEQNVCIMKENVKHMQEIQDLRQQLKNLTHTSHMQRKWNHSSSSASNSESSSMINKENEESDVYENEDEKYQRLKTEVEQQKKQMEQLKRAILNLRGSK